MKKLPALLSALSLCAVLAAGVHADAPAAPDAHAQVGQVVERFRTAIIARDKATLEGLFLPGGSWFEVLGEAPYRTLKARRPELKRIHPDDYRDFAAYVGNSSQPIEEKFSNVRIETDGTVASVYFDFVFLAGGKAANTGSETWQLVNTGEGWKISAMAYSSNPPPH
ncbi:hypothetical protein ASG87_12020 [Frateuria sp. Soil773]|uniref:nuclear transport factor 2 family protein n=1 Tax=Frateuria sp. Soil773 TaxID=1736407 RepID=UPI0006FD1E29|nr:nuclear transport factor 2 family protein [Frateuria sp. Soil773]KRF02185.1 hypothetical protein ASG87_12020 [Frateuria sp. Soil773]